MADHQLVEDPQHRAGRRIDDFGLIAPDSDVPFSVLAPLVTDAFSALWDGRAEADGFNALILRAQLSWREAGLFRAAYKYLRQAGLSFSQSYVERTLLRRVELARALAAAFAARLDPSHAARGEEDSAVGEVERLLGEVSRLDEDRVLRGLWQFVQAVVRTNWYQRTSDGLPKLYSSFKLNPAEISILPAPLPWSETFVYSPRMEGLHLRAAKVSRGGIRWSDRPEDFRTEVLALMRGQTVKNAVIVPSGAKGAFVVKSLAEESDPGRVAAEVRDCYATFIRGLLDLTDNLVDGAPVGPPEVVRRDEQDTYLVVAADKGTATLSDLANAIASEYGYWLGDAFASGGSTGYDHKAMAITARGAWVSVRHHLRHLDLDIDRDDFTVVGIGDMSGDVFGNAMLLSPRTLLLGAFDHRHIFLDPDPDPDASYAERQRLFRCPGSTWADYDSTRLSPGGGVFARSTKSVPLSPEVRRRLDVQAGALAPHEVVRALLRAPVDLLFNGGIGTYVKASSEAHVDAADPANNAVRVDAGELRCRAVSEGGNLGFTQRGRIEFALNGGRINTDFIDNSAGVDMSDHEVNLKTLLDSAVAEQSLTRARRDALLGRMADDVARRVLENNEQQTRAISVAEAQSALALDRHVRLIDNLEAVAGLDRQLEALPDAAAIGERRAAGKGLTRPEIAVLLACSKNSVKRELLASDVPDESYFAAQLADYFPRSLGESLAASATAHPLAREIVATLLANRLLNHVGPGLLYRLDGLSISLR